MGSSRAYVACASSDMHLRMRRPEAACDQEKAPQMRGFLFIVTHNNIGKKVPFIHFRSFKLRIYFCLKLNSDLCFSQIIRRLNLGFGYNCQCKSN